MNQDHTDILPSEGEKGKIILYQPNESVKLEVRVENETVWLTQAQMAELFDVKENTITYHIKEIYKCNELDADSTARKIRVVRKEGTRNVNRQIDFYNFDDRYLIVDNQVWLLGASVKDMGRGLCTVIRLGFTPEDVLKRIT